MKILCCGFFPALQRTLEYKNFRPGEVNRAKSVSIAASGKATNTARVLSQLGADPLLLSFSGGGNGKTVRNLLEQEKLPCHWVETEVETRICQTLLTANSDRCTELVEESPPLTLNEWKAFIKAFTELEEDFDQILFSGNLPAHAPQDIYAKLLSHTDGEKVLIDSSGAPLLATLEHRPALIKLNEEELRMTIKTPGEATRPTKSGAVAAPKIRGGEPEEKARELIAHGAGAVGITAGKSSAMLVTPEALFTYSIPVIDAVNPIGSGDSVSAGIAYALAKGSALPEAFAFGLACGSSNAMNLAPGHIELDQIAELAPQIQINK